MLAGAGIVAVAAGVLTAPAATAATPGTIPDGPQTTLVVTSQFASDNGDPHITTDEAMKRVFTGTDSANSWLKEVSGNRISLTGVKNPAGDVIGPVMMTDAAKGCNIGELLNQGRAAATAQGYDVSKYLRTIVYTSPGAGCNGGKANVGGINGGGWVQADWYSSTPMLTHEIGHNLGLAHSGVMRCTDANGNPAVLYKSGFDSIVGQPDNCTSDGEGDVYDTMGYDGGWYNAPHLSQLGWITPSQQKTVTTNGVYTINAVEDNAGALRTLRLPINAPLHGAEIWIEHRASVPGNQYDQFNATDKVTQGISLRISSWKGQTRLLNMHPGTGSFWDTYNSQLNVGESFTYPGLATIKLLGIDAATNTAQVQITKVPMILTDKTLPGATAGTAYSTKLTERGGTPAFTWTIDSGTLPPGVTLATDGTLSGTPTTPGTYSFKVRLRDAAAQKDWRTFTITVT
ncbi:putative Ig domain-containing protein [Arthrobacter sp. MMS24-S77]